MIIEIPSICQVKKCERPAQVYAAKTMSSSGKNQYLKTCCRHSYKDLLK
jgi:hypothetical protein